MLLPDRRAELTAPFNWKIKLSGRREEISTSSAPPSLTYLKYHLPFLAYRDPTQLVFLIQMLPNFPESSLEVVV